MYGNLHSWLSLCKQILDQATSDHQILIIVFLVHKTSRVQSNCDIITPIEIQQLQDKNQIERRSLLVNLDNLTRLNFIDIARNRNIKNKRAIPQQMDVIQDTLPELLERQESNVIGVLLKVGSDFAADVLIREC